MMIKKKLPSKTFLLASGGYKVKKEQGQERRYIYGVASGVGLDGHSQYMSENCIQGFHDQFSSGNILLYADKHDISSLTDIGIATDSTILDNNDWVVEFRLYDNLDGVDQNSIDLANKLWLQVNGLPPYGSPIEKGFSIEGDGIKKRDNMGREYFDYIDLSSSQGGGVVVVPDPAYKESFIMSVKKSVQHITAVDALTDIREVMQEKKEVNEELNSFWDDKWLLESALEKSTMAIMNDDRVMNKREIIEQKANEWAQMYVEIVMRHPKAFQETDVDHIIKDFKANEKAMKEMVKKGIEPEKSEVEEAFLVRFMADSKMVSEFPDQIERAAVSFLKFRITKSANRVKKVIDANSEKVTKANIKKLGIITNGIQRLLGEKNV